MSALDLLAELLDDGEERPQVEVLEAMAAAGYTEHQALHARRKLHVRTRKAGWGNARWVWSLPKDGRCPTCRRLWDETPTQPVGPEFFGYVDGEYVGPAEQPQEHEDTPEPVDEPSPPRQPVIDRYPIGVCYVCGAPGQVGERCTMQLARFGWQRCAGLCL